VQEVTRWLGGSRRDPDSAIQRGSTVDHFLYNLHSFPCRSVLLKYAQPILLLARVRHSCFYWLASVAPLRFPWSGQGNLASRDVFRFARPCLNSSTSQIHHHQVVSFIKIVELANLHVNWPIQRNWLIR
jgi:hypothetical protein